MRIIVQGDLLAVRGFANAKTPHVTRGVRGGVVGLSVSARRRLLRLASALDVNKPALFVTLTAPHGTDDSVVRQAYNAFREAMRRAYPDAAWLWRIERQKNGTLHYHLLVYNVPKIPGAWLWDTWSRIMHTRARVDVRRVTNRRMAVRYVSKYLAKRDDARPTNTSLVDVPYLHAAAPIAGRQWGIHNRAMMPWAATVEIECDYDLARYVCWWITRGLFRRAEAWSGNLTAMSDKASAWFAHLARLADCVPSAASIPLVC